MKRKPLKPKKSIGLDGFSQFLRHRSNKTDNQYPPVSVDWAKLFRNLKQPKLKL